MKSKIDLYLMKKVKEHREAQGLSQMQLANKMKMSVGFIGKVESPNYGSHYNLEHLNKLAKILKCSPQNFMPRNGYDIKRYKGESVGNVSERPKNKKGSIS